MKIQKQILYVPLIIMLLCSSAYATAQTPEILFYEDTPYKLYNTHPLESFYKSRNDRPEFHIEPDAISTGNYRGYVGTWEIKDGELLLIGINGWILEGEEWVMADLGTLFGDKYKEYRVAATWFTGEIRLTYGKRVVNNRGFGDIYEWETVLKIESGKVVDKETIDNKKDALLINAAREGNLADVRAALAEGADINAKDNLWGSPLISASSKGYREIVILLLDKGADVNAKPRIGNTALEGAKGQGHEDIVKLLKEAGAKE